MSRRLAPGLTVPQRSSRQMPVGMPSEEDLGQQLQRCLTDMALPVDVRAAGAIVTLFGLPLSKIVQLTAEHLTERDGNVYLTMDKQLVLMPPRMGSLPHSAARASSRSAHAASALPEQTSEVSCDLRVVLARKHPEDAEQGVFSLSGTEECDGKHLTAGSDDELAGKR